ncbi:hypothetical protein [Nakamurella sp.]|uniref:hypothetical protein n=1 Tax=Nakamurella sp. TaxID=1869182 RepID=UPI0037850895
MRFEIPDDDLESSVFDHILTADSLGSIVAAFTASGPRPAFGTPKDEERDPARILSGDEEIIRRRIAQVAPDGAAHYVAMLETIRDRSRRSTPVEQVFHAAREMVGAVAEALLPVALSIAERRDIPVPVRPEREGDAWRRQVFVAVLGLDEAVSKAWRELSPSSLAHRERGRPARVLTPDLISKAQGAATIAQEMIILFEQYVDEVLQQIRDLIHGPPSKPAAVKLAGLVRLDPDYIQFLFDSLDEPVWWSFLAGQRLFDFPPEPTKTAHPAWSPSRYLARIADRAPDRPNLMWWLVKIGDCSTNVRVHEDILRAAMALGSAHLFEALARARHWLDLPLHDRVARLGGDDRVIRFPAWYAHACVVLILDPGATPAQQLYAERSLRELFAFGPAEDGSQPLAIWLTGINLARVVTHLLEHVGRDGRRLLLQVLSETVISVIGELNADGGWLRELREATADHEIDGAVQRASDWVGAQDDFADPSSLLVPILWEAPTDTEDLVQLIAALVETVGVGRDDPLIDTMLAEPGCGLLTRLWLARVAADRTARPDTVLAVARNPRIRRSPWLRGEFRDMLSVHWPRLSDSDRDVVRQDVLDDAKDCANAAASLAPLVEVDDHASIRHAWESAVGTGRLAVEIAPIYSMGIGRFMSVVDKSRATRPRPEPDSGWIQDPVTGILLPRSELESSDWDRWPPALVPPWKPPRRYAELEATELWTSADWTKAVKLLRGCLGPLPQPPTPDSRRRRRLATDLLTLMGKRLRERRPTTGQVETLCRMMAEPPLNTESIRFEHQAWAEARAAFEAVDRQPAGQAVALLLQLFTDRSWPDRDLAPLVHRLTGALSSPGASRPVILAVVGLWTGALYQIRPQMTRVLLEPLLESLDKVEVLEVQSRSQGLREGPQTDLTWFLAGFFENHHAFPAGLHQYLEPFYGWFFTNADRLAYRDPADPPGVIRCVAHAILVDGGRADGPNAGVFRRCAPAHLIAATMIYLGSALSTKWVATPEDARRLWVSVREWDADAQHRPIPSVISAWAATPDLVRACGPDWFLAQLNEALDVAGTVHDPARLLRSLADVSRSGPATATKIVEFVGRLHRLDLLRGVRAPVLDDLIAATRPGAREASGRLASSLTADRLIGPLSVTRPARRAGDTRDDRGSRI